MELLRNLTGRKEQEGGMEEGGGRETALSPERTETESMRTERKHIPTPARSRSVFELR